MNTKTEEQIVELTSKPDAENKVSIISYYLGHKMHIKVPFDFKLEHIEEISNSVKLRMMMDLEDYISDKTSH